MAVVQVPREGYEGRAAPAPPHAALQDAQAPHAAQADAFTATSPPDAWALDRLCIRLRDASQLLAPLVARAVRGLVKCQAATFYSYARLDDYAKVEHDRGASWFRNWAKLGDALDNLPALEAAVTGRSGRRIGSCAATVLATIATPDTIDAWIERARRVTVRELSEEIRARRSTGQSDPGPEPGEPGEFLEGDAPAAAAADGPGAHPPAASNEPAPWGLCASRTTLDEDDLNIEPRILVGFDAPRKLDLAFADTLDLHRAVTGSEAPVHSFVEALAAEAAAGMAPPDCCATPLESRDTVARAEHACARANKRWEKLQSTDASAGEATGERAAGTTGDAPPEPPPVPPSGRRSTRRRRALHAWGTEARIEVSWDEIATLEAHARAIADAPSRSASRAAGATRNQAIALHEELRGLLQFEDRVERCVGRLLYLMRVRGDLSTLGFASVGHYAFERLSMPRRTGEWRAHIVHALRHWPRVFQAYESGAIGLEGARELYRIHGAVRLPVEVQESWIEHAKELDVKRLREERRRLRRQELTTPEPPVTAFPQPKPHPLPATDSEWLASLRRAPGDTRGRLRALHLPGIDDPNATLSDLCRTNQFLRFRLPPETATAFRGALEAARRRLTEQATAWINARDAAAGKTTAANRDAGSPRDTLEDPRGRLRASLRAAIAFMERHRRVPTWAAFLALLEDYAETHDDPRGFPRRRRDDVYNQWGWICAVPGCTVRVGVEDHHIQYRSHRGSDQLHNQVLLCAFHHRMGEHGELLRCWGTAPGNIHWQMGAPPIARHYVNGRRVERSK